MRSSINGPLVGEKMTADWARRVVEELRANRILPSDGYRVHYSRNGTRLDFDAQAKATQSPIFAQEKEELYYWKVRWMSHDPNDSSKGEWQVYAPTKALQIQYSAALYYYGFIKNDKAKDSEGKEIIGWYKINISEEEADPAWDERYGAGVSRDVVVNIDPWGDATIETVANALYHSNQGGNLEVKYRWSQHIAVIREFEHNEGSQKTVYHYTYRAFTENIIRYQENIKSQFGIQYERKEGDEKVAKIINQYIYAGRTLVKKAEDTIITDDTTDVWMKLTHSGETFELDVVFEDPGESNNDQTCFKLYTFQNRIVINDYCDALPEFFFYTNSST